MRNAKAILLAAAITAMPVTPSRAATITYQFYNFLFGTSPTTITSSPGTLPGTNVSGTGAAEIVAVPVGDYVSFGMEAEVVNSDGYGLGAFSLGLNNSNPASSAIYTTNYSAGALLASTVIPRTVYDLATFRGEYDGAGGVLGTATGAIAGVIQSGQADVAQSQNGAGSFAPLFSAITVSTAAPGSTVFTPIQVSSDTYFFAPAASSSNFSARVFSNVTDTIAPLPTLTINASGAVPEPSSAGAVIVCTAGLLWLRRGRNEGIRT
jgi:hypothetical protein